MNPVKLLLILLLLITPVFADSPEKSTDIKSIISNLPELNDRTCKFSQKKILPTGIILESSGNFVYKKKDGVTFFTTYPVKTTSLPQNFTEVNNVIKAIGTKSYGKIEKEFNFFYETHKHCWVLALKPKQKSRTENFIKSIMIEGSAQIDKIVILSTDGTKTEIVYY